MRPLLTVVVPTYQRRDSLLRLLASLRTQTLPADAYEVIAAVDGSTDGTVEAVRDFSAPYALCALGGPNRGRAGACNAGIRAAAGDLVVLLDDDMEASPGFLAAHARAHEGPVERAVVGAAPIVVSPASSRFVRYMANGFRMRLERLAQPGYRLRFRDVYTGNFSARRDVLLAAGGFDEAFRVYGHEDYELALRLQESGVELTYCADAYAHQHYEKTFAAFARDGIARGRTAVLFAGKHPAVVERIKLSEYRQGALTWRALRGLLLQLSRASDRVPEWIVRLIGRLERWEPARLDKYYTLAIDYLFWYGALAARREQRPGGASGSIPLSARPAAASPASWPRGRVWLAVLMVLLYAGASSVRWLHRSADWPARPGLDEISAYDRRFAELRPVLPAGGVIGYLGHPAPTGSTPREANAAALLHFRRYLLAQYALAPLLLIESTEPDLVVGNFEAGAQPPPPVGFRVVRDFGEGLLVFRRSGR